MNVNEWLQYYQYVRLNDRRKAEMIERTGGLKTIIDIKTCKKRLETQEEAVIRIKAEIDELPNPPKESLK